MSLFGNYLNKKIRQVLTQDLSDNIDPSAVILRDEQYAQLENRVWYTANNAVELETFYKQNIPNDNMIGSSRRFYNKVQGKMPRVHVPLATAITNTTVNLVFNEKPDINVDTGNKKVSAALSEMINDTIDENGGEQFMKDFAAMVSYSGCAAIKFIIDPEFSDNVIFQPYPAEDIIVKKKYGRISEIVFKDYYDDDYTLFSHYGYGYIHYELKHKDTVVNLHEIPETQDIHDITFTYKDGSPVKCLMAVYMDNTSGHSDYAGIIDQLIMIDELKSTMLYIERSTKPKLGIPSGLCEIDIDTGKTIMPDSWDIDSTLLEVEDPEDKVKNMNTVSYTSPDMSQLLSLYNSTLKEILNTVGLSPNTLGIEDTSGANASSLALNIREHASLRKRATLILCYTKAFQELAKLILMYNGAIISNDRCIVEDVSNYEYTVDFSEYDNPTFDSRVDTLSKALSAGLISQREAIHELYDNTMSNNDQEAMIEDINKKNYPDTLNNTLYKEGESNRQPTIQDQSGRDTSISNEEENQVSPKDE